ncbi:MAG: Omp28-related outer membrane protein [Bacteroidales bacterium]|jgi:hypothetical protein|nr:Omp28-related outer membrane protein [Bacteroidales bacterium]
MKSIFTVFIFVLFVNITFAQAPTFVSTIPANKNVILEEFTGTGCSYCPDGHIYSNIIANSNPGRFWEINIHAGSNALTNPANYRTTDGEIIHDHFISTEGYPSGMINRGGILSRSFWFYNTNTALNQLSYANIAAEGILDFETRTLTLTVELYYTSESSVPSNFVTVAMVQNNIIGPQANASSNQNQYVEDAVNSYNYKHMHMLRDIISPTWGDTVTSTTTESFYTKTYTYVIPDNIKNIPVVLEDLEFLVWVAEDKSNIITANKAEIEYVNIHNYPTRITTVREKNILACNSETEIYFELKAGGDTIRSIEANYSINGETPVTFLWDAREIPALKSDSIHIYPITVAINEEQVIDIQITKINGNDVSSISNNITVKKNIVTGVDNMTFKITTDYLGSEITWKFLDPDGEIINQGGPFAFGINSYEYSLEASFSGCYALIVYDSGSNGINGLYGSGNFSVVDQSGNTILYDNGQFDSKAVYMMNITAHSNIAEKKPDTFFIYPNPVSEQLFIQCPETIDQIKIFNTQGQLLKLIQDNVSEISIIGLPDGFYILHVITGKGTFIQQFVKQ